MDICSSFTVSLFILEPLEPQASPGFPLNGAPPLGYRVADLAIYLYFYHLVKVFHHLLPHKVIHGVCEWTYLCSA